MNDHAVTIYDTIALHRQDLLARAERERRAAVVHRPAPEWRQFAARALVFVALALGLRT